MKRIIIADEQPLARQALRAMLESAGHQVTAECADGPSALHQTLQQRPDLLILELALPRLGGLELLRRLHQAGSKSRTLVLTAQDTEHFAGLSLQAGSSGFIGKQQSLDELLSAVASVLGGHSYFPSQALDSLTKGGPQDEKVQLASLSAREMTVLRYLASGSSIKRIASELALSDRTVSTYKTRLLEKLNVGSLAELLELAWRNHLLGQVPQVLPQLSSDPQQPLSEQFHAKFDDLQLAVSLRDAESRLLAGNRAFFSFHAITETAQLGSRITDSISLSPEQALELHHTYRRAYLDGEPYFRHLVLQGPPMRSLLHWGAPFHDQAGALLGMICTGVDISQHEHQLLLLKEANHKLIAVQDRHRRFLVDVGQRSLGTLEALSQQLQQAHERSDELLAGARHTLTHLQQDLQALLDLARMENGEHLLSPRSTPLQAITRQLCQALAGELGFDVEVFTDGPDFNAWIDVSRYRQLLREMLRHGGQCGASSQALTARWQWLAQGKLEWALTLSPNGAMHPPPALAGPAMAQATLCQRLAHLMGGRFDLLDQGEPLAQLRLHLDRSAPL